MANVYSGKLAQNLTIFLLPILFAKILFQYLLFLEYFIVKFAFIICIFVICILIYVLDYQLVINVFRYSYSSDVQPSNLYHAGSPVRCAQTRSSMDSPKKSPQHSSTSAEKGTIKVIIM